MSATPSSSVLPPMPEVVADAVASVNNNTPAFTDASLGSLTVGDKDPGTAEAFNYLRHEVVKMAEMYATLQQSIPMQPQHSQPPSYAYHHPASSAYRQSRR